MASGHVDRAAPVEAGQHPPAASISRVDTLASVAEAEWDALPGASSFYLSHRWLSFVEHEQTAQVCYLLAMRAGRLVGALPTYAVAVETNQHYRVETATGGQVSGEFLLAGARRAYQTGLMHDSPGANAPDPVLDLLLEQAQEQAASAGLAGVGFLYASTQTAQRLVQAYPQARPLLIDIDVELPLSGDGFGDYLATLGKRRGHAVRQERRRFAEAGYELSLEPLSECWYELGPLVANVQQRYGHDDTAADCRAGLRAQAEAAGEQSVVFCLRRAGALCAGALFFQWRDSLYGRVVGFDYPALADAGEYFNLYFYQPIEYAYRHGYRRLHLGKGSYFAKLRRGAHAKARWAVFFPAEHVPAHWRELNRAALARARRDYQFRDLDAPVEWL